MQRFLDVREKIAGQYTDINWIEESGLSKEELVALCNELTNSNLPKATAKAKTFELIATRSCIAIDPDDIFQEKLCGYGIMAKQRNFWEKIVTDKYLIEEKAQLKQAWEVFGSHRGGGDYGHTSPNSRLLLEVGLAGLFKRVNLAADQENLSEKQVAFYDSCKIVLKAMMCVAGRLADAIEPYNPDNAKALRAISVAAPANIYEAMQLLVFYFFMHEYVAGTRVRTLGRLDVLLTPFYENDIKNGTYTKSEIKEMIKFFLHKFWVAKVPFDLPFCLGGLDENGNEVTNEVTYLIAETYNELNIHSPKIHIRVSKKTPDSFLSMILSYIRGGNSSFVFVNDNVAVKALMNVGIEQKDALDYVPIGCYEPAVWGKEIGCTGNGGLNLAKAIEYAITDGVDLKSGVQAMPKRGEVKCFDDFLSAVKFYITLMCEQSLGYISSIEKYYDEINPDPILSAMYEDSVRRGVDVYEGGAKYNNSSMYFYCLASLIDSLAAVKCLVYDQKLISFEGLCELLKKNWQGGERLRLRALNLKEKYGNSDPLTDKLTTDITDFCASLVNSKPNGRGGVFKAALFSIDRYVRLGERTMATPDGRLAGEILSKNLCSTVSMDKNGITALIHSVTKIDHSKFPNGSVLDILLHPSAVSGEDGLKAFLTILKTYMAKGGFALHGNVFDAKILKEAQKDPQRYATLQVRVCGWNAYFVNLSQAEQNAFIKQAENIGG